MAKKERNRRSGRKARQQERAEREALQAASAPKDAKAKRASRSSKSVGPKKSVNSSEKGGALARTRTYFRDVRSEMNRVTWPDRKELTSYSVTVIVMLVVFGVAVWAVDTGFVAALVAFAGLRG